MTVTSTQVGQPSCPLPGRFVGDRSELMSLSLFKLVLLCDCHAIWVHAAYIYAGGLPYELTEGDLLAVFSQYGEIVDVNLVRDKKTGMEL